MLGRDAEHACGVLHGHKHRIALLCGRFERGHDCGTGHWASHIPVNEGEFRRAALMLMQSLRQSLVLVLRQLLVLLLWALTPREPLPRWGGKTLGQRFPHGGE